MIKYLLYKEIDFEKYNQCILESDNALIYAYSWYLDCVAPEWSVLILNNYEAVMPLPVRRKYGINYIFQPSWVQQLGIFSNKEIDENLVANFINSIPQKIKLIDVLFNYKNKFSNKNLSVRDNYILNINKSYEDLFDGFNKLRKRSIKKATRLNLKIKSTNDAISLIDLFKNNKGAELHKSVSDYDMLNKLVLKGIENGNVEIYTVDDKESKIISGVVFLKSKNRIIYLFSASNQEGKEVQAVSFIINYMIQKNCNSNIVLDFEGSMIPGIALFFKSFGAINEPYYWFRKKKLI